MLNYYDREAIAEEREAKQASYGKYCVFCRANGLEPIAYTIYHEDLLKKLKAIFKAKKKISSSS